MNTPSQMYIEQTLGKALGYPKYTMSPEAFPECPADSDMVCIGDNNAVSLAEQAASRIANLQADQRLKLHWGVFVGDTLVLACATKDRAKQMARLGRRGTDPALGKFSVKYLMVR